MTHEQSQQFEDDKLAEMQIGSSKNKNEIRLEKMKMIADSLIEHYRINGDQDSLDSMRSIKISLMHLRVGV